jgi:FkbM family methyltransferase
MRECNGVWLPEEDTHMVGQISRSKVVAGHATYQYPKLLRAMEYVTNRGAAVDVGAHVGLWTMQLARLFGRVDAFEPLQEHADCLRVNAGGMENVWVWQSALGASCGHLKMTKLSSNSGMSFINPDSQIGEEVEVGRLDDFKFENVGLIKLDCEGYEYFVLHGGMETIRRCRPVVIVEQHVPSVLRYAIPATAACELLIREGYRETDIMTDDHILVPC